MLYCLEQGPTEQAIITACIRDRMPLPERIANAPALFLGLELYYGAFADLNTCRAEGPISWLTIDEYAQRRGLCGEQKEDLFFFVREMDNAYLEFQRGKT